MMLFQRDILTVQTNMRCNGEHLLTVRVPLYSTCRVYGITYVSGEVKESYTVELPAEK